MNEVLLVTLAAAFVVPEEARALSADDGWLSSVDPGLRAVAERRLVEIAPPLGPATLDHWRAGLRAATPSLAVAPRVTSVSVPVPGSPDVLVHVVGADRVRRRPIVLHLHGGGFVMGTARSSLPALQRLSAALDCVVASVEYRLAPETTWMGSTADAYAALLWLHRSADHLGVDRTRIALLGESAGGGLAALLALTARDRGEVRLVFQALVYPMLDDRTVLQDGLPPGVGRVVWTPTQNSFGWHSFLSVEPGGADVPSGAVPARCTDLAGLPPTFIGVGSLDLFLREDVAYARRLAQAGVRVELLVVPGAFHAFDLLAPTAAASRQFTAALTAALARALRRGSA